jgi:hypothetical protein
MATLTDKSCWALVSQTLLVKLLCAEMSEYCGCCAKFVWPNGDPLEGWEDNWEPKLWRVAVGLHIIGLDASPCIRRVSCVPLSLCFQNLNISLSWTLCCNRRTYVITHFYAGCVYVMYYFVIITFVIMPRGDPNGTNRPFLWARCHSWYQSFTGIIHHVPPYFRKHTVRKCLDAHIRTIVVLTGGKLIVFKFCNYGKKLWCDF